MLTSARCKTIKFADYDGTAIEALVDNRLRRVLFHSTGMDRGARAVYDGCRTTPTYSEVLGSISLGVDTLTAVHRSFKLSYHNDTKFADKSQPEPLPARGRPPGANPAAEARHYVHLCYRYARDRSTGAMPTNVLRIFIPAGIRV